MKRASYPSLIRKSDIDFRKLVDKIEKAEITIYLEEREKLKLQFVKIIQTTTSLINNIQNSANDLAEKSLKLQIFMKRKINFKSKPFFK